MVEGVEQPEPALQVIILGSGGGPLENNTTSLLVRSTASGWRRGSILGVDAGIHLSAIVKILEKHSSDYSPGNDQKAVTLVDGPLEGLEIPHSSAKANAAHITRTLIDTYLITHPHLDHISGFVINTAGLPASRPKRLAGLPSTIEAFKNHIFNNVIWPNLSDENNGAGLVTYMRLVDGGSPALGDGEGRGYVEICEGLSVKTWSISHGHCIENHSHRGSTVGVETNLSRREASPRSSPRRSSQLRGSSRSLSTASLTHGELLRSDSREEVCVYNSSAYFIRDIPTGNEILVFGDVEPDSLSLSPRNKLVWMEAAPKIVSGRLRGIFIECSFDDSQSDDRLYGHLSSKFLMEELKALAHEVRNHREAISKEAEGKKRKRLSNGSHPEERIPRRSSRASKGQVSPISPRTQGQTRFMDVEASQSDGRGLPHDPKTLLTDVPIRTKYEFPLGGLEIIVIHVKDRLVDGPEQGDIILKELEAYEEEAQLGCKFTISKAGQAVYF